MVPLPLPATQPIETSTVTVVQPKSVLDANWKQGPFLEIFVRAYADSDGDGVGDFRGLTQKLDYIASLGVRGLWLMPVHPNQDGDHGYSVTNYRAIAADHGTLADFDHFVAQAHQRGIGVVMDYVINHSASAHPIFAATAASKTHPQRDWYVWRDIAPTGWRLFDSDPWKTLPTGAYLAGFHHTMPDFNLMNPAVVDFHLNNMRFWLNRGVDGFRFDAVSHLVENGPDSMIDQSENFAILQRIRESLSVYENRFYVGEGTTNAQRYGAPIVLGSAFAFGLNGDLIKAAKGDGQALARAGQYFLTHPHFGMSTFLNNHDEFAGKRLADQFENDSQGVRLAMMMLMTLPGVPFIYYGDEVGMNSGAGLTGDPSLRVPMSWRAEISGFSSGQPFRAPARNAATHHVVQQENDPESLLNFTRALLKLRTQHAALARGDYTVVENAAGTLRFERKSEGARAHVIVNTSNTSRRYTLSQPMQALWPRQGSGSITTVEVPARSGWIGQ